MVSEQSSRSNRLVRNTAFLVVRMLLLMFIGLFTSREVLRILGVDDLGVYHLVGTIVGMFGFLQMALNNATTRYITFDLGANAKKRLQHTFSMSLTTEMLLALTIVVLSEIVGPWLIGHKLNIPDGRMHAAQMVFQISLISIVVGLLSTPYSSLIVAHERMDFFAYVSIVEGVMKLLILYLLTTINFDKLILYAWLLVGVSVTVFLLQWVYCKIKFTEAKFVFQWDGKLIRKLCNYSGLSLLVNMSDAAVGQSISIYFNIFSGVVANAALGVAYQVRNIVSLFQSNFSQSYWPQVIKSYAAGDRDYFMNLLHSASKLSFFLLFLLAFPVMLNIDFLLDVWLVTPPAQTGAFLCVICIYALIDAFSQPLWQAVHATGNLKVHQLLIGGIKILNVPVSYGLLIAGMPVITCLVVYAVSNAVCAVVRIWWLTHLIKFDAPKYVREVLWPMSKIVIISIPIPLLAGWLMPSSFFRCFATTILFLGIYVPGIYFLALSEKERMLFTNLALNIMKRIGIKNTHANQ